MKPVPSTIEIQTKLYQNLKQEFGFEDDSYKSVLDAISSVIAAEVRIMYMYVADNRNNQFPDTADLAEDGGELERLGNIYLNRQPKLATQGLYKVALTGSAGSLLRESLVFKANAGSGSAGSLYILDEAYEMSGVNDFINLRSLSAGLDFLLNVGDKLTVTEPVIGLNSESEMVEILEKPISEESIDIYRKNINDAIQLEPQGGASTDYRLWASDAQGVRLVYPYVKESQAGTAQVFVEATKEDSEDGNGTPSTFILNEVEEVVRFDPDESLDTNYRGRIPMGVPLEVLPIVTKPVDIEIIGLTNSLPSTIQSIRDSINSYIYNIRPFVGGGDLLRNKNDILYNYKLSNIVSDVLGNSGYFEDFKMSVDGNEVNKFTFSRQNIPYLRNIITT
jgi:uncharacterized phage protein gp47/JayE